MSMHLLFLGHMDPKLERIPAQPVVVALSAGSLQSRVGYVLGMAIQTEEEAILFLFSTLVPQWKTL